MRIHYNQERRSDPERGRYCYTGTEAAWVPYALAAVSTVATAEASSRADDQRQKSISALYANRDEATKKQVESIFKEAQSYDPSTRGAQETDVRSKIEQALGADLQAALDPNARQVNLGPVSSEALSAEATGRAREAGRAAKLIRLYSAVEAPTVQRFQESLRGANEATNRGAVAGGANAYGQRIGAHIGGIQPDSTLQTIGGLAGAGAQITSTNQASDQIRRDREKDRIARLYNTQ